MIRHLKILLFGMALIGLMAGSAFAGTTQVNQGAANAAYTASLEAMGAARNAEISANVAAAAAAANYAVTYSTSQQIATSNFLSVTLTGAAFTGNTIRMCKAIAAGANTDGIYAVATPPAASTSYNFQINYAAAGDTNDLVAGSILYLTTATACSNSAGSMPASNLLLQLSSTSAATSPSIAVAIISSGGLSVDTSSTKQLALITKEYTVGFAATNHSVDYLAVTPANGTRLNPGNVAFAGTPAANNAINIRVPVALNFTANGSQAGGAAATNAGITVSGVVQLTDTAAWQGASKVFLSNFANYNGTCTDNAGGNLVGTGSPSGTLSFTIPAGAFNGGIQAGGAAAANLAVCLMADGNSLSQPRTIQASVAINTGTGGNSDAATSFTTLDSWDTNAYQGYATWVVNSSLVPTYCLISNNDTTKSVTALLDVASSEGGVVLSGTLGTIASKTSNMLTFTGNSASLTDGTAVDLTTLLADKRYAAKITLTTSPNNATVTCIQTDPTTGAKRAVPVVTNSPWLQ